MAKKTGGVRNYARYTKTYKKRRAEYYRLLATGEYEPSRSHFYKSGGFVVTHKRHKEMQRDERGRLVDKSDIAARNLARKGFRVYLDSEESNKVGVATPDGRIERMPMEIKTINKAGRYSMKRGMEKATTQGVNAVIFMQGTKAMTREYVEGQLNLFKAKSPRQAREKLEYVYIVGMNGNVHKHEL